MCKQLSAQEELLTHDEMKGVTLTADKLLYLHAIDLCLNAASLEFFGKAQEVSRTTNETRNFSPFDFSVLNLILKRKFSFTVWVNRQQPIVIERSYDNIVKQSNDVYIVSKIRVLLCSMSRRRAHLNVL